MIEAIALGERIIAYVINNVWAERTLYVVMAISILMAFAYDVYRGRDLRARYLSAGVRTDIIYGVIVMSHIQAMLIVGPFTAIVLDITSSPWFRFDQMTAIPFWLQLLLAFAYRDCFAYWYHRAQHANAWLWQTHKVHHSVEHMTVLSTFRFTLVDLLVEAMIFVPIAGVSGSLELPFALYVLNLFRSSLQHSDTGWTFGPIGWLIVSPAFHETHHSTALEHRDKNFSVMFSVWDHLFGTYSPREKAQLTYGLVGDRIPESFFVQLFVPLAGYWRLARGFRRSVQA